MNLRLIKTEDDYDQALARIDALMAAKPGTPEGEELELLAVLVEMYEEKHYPIDLPDPIEAIKFRMDQAGLSQKDLIPYIGSKSKVSEVLNKKRPLTLSMMRALHKGLGISAEVLLSEPDASFPEELLGFVWKKFPISQMAKRGWISVAGDIRDNAEEAMRGFLARAGEGGIPAVAFKKGFGSRINPRTDNHALMAWCWQVATIAQEEQLEATYKRGVINQAFLQSVARLSFFDEGPQLAKEFLNKNGIHLILLPHLDKTYLDGAAMLLPNGAPVIGMTLRHDRLDNFWFVLIHELVHIAKHLCLSGQRVIADDMDLRAGESEPEDLVEKEADFLAEEVLVPQKVRTANSSMWDKQSPLKGRQLSQAVSSLAFRLQVHPAVIAGGIRYQRNNYKVLHHMIGQGQVRIQFFNDMQYSENN
ncbi:MAG: transcriptional regulator [Desulfatibacillum sp.]|nr:transcriptional regulator [Desulfatibacillum sp.]